MNRIAGLLAILSIISTGAHGATIQAGGCSSASVQTAINSAVAGDTVQLPAPCSATWNPNSISINAKGITLDGRGAKITRGSGSDGSPIVSLTTHASTVTRITGFNFSGSGVSNQGYFIALQTPSTDNSPALFRIDHSAFDGQSVGVHIKIFGNGHGLIDHCSFIINGNNEVIQTYGFGQGSTTGWTNDVYPGTHRATYMEDNTFTNAASSGNFMGGKTAAFAGSRQVVRYNTFSGVQVDQHGTAGMVGARWWEIYKNTVINRTNAAMDKFHQIRAGSGVIFADSIPTNCAGACRLALWEEDAGYPAAYQIGRGKCVSSPCTSGSNQALTPVYIWQKDPDQALALMEASANQIVANRDYYIETSSFNGTSGVGVGVRSSRPAACTKNVAYWSTDQGGNWDTTHGGANDGCLDKCTATNTWTNCAYVPYVYPHPLASGSGGNGGASLPAPTNLRTLM